MRTMSRLVPSVLLLLPAVALAGPESGPKPGTKVEPLTVFVAAGDQEGNVIDVVAERQGKPTVVLFVQAAHWDRPMARFLRVLDEALARGIQGAEDASAVAVWLTDDVPAAKEYLPIAQMSVNFTHTPLAVFEGSRFGPNGWAVNVDAYLTVVVVRDGKVSGSLGFISVGENDLPAVVELLRKKS